MLQGLLHAALGYVRWTQMVPMLLVWAFFLLGLAGALLIGFQEEGVGLLTWLHEQTGRIPGLHNWLATYLETSEAVTDSGGLRLTDENLTPLVTRAWLILAAVLLIVEWAWRLMRGGEAPTPWPLRRKLLLACVAALAGMAAMTGALAAAGAGEDVTLMDAIPTIIVGFVLLFVISAYSLSVSHLVNRIQAWMDSRDDANAQAVR